MCHLQPITEVYNLMTSYLSFEAGILVMSKTFPCKEEVIFDLIYDIHCTLIHILYYIYSFIDRYIISYILLKINDILCNYAQFWFYFV